MHASLVYILATGNWKHPALLTKFRGIVADTRTGIIEHPHQVISRSLAQRLILCYSLRTHTRTYTHTPAHATTPIVDKYTCQMHPLPY